MLVEVRGKVYRKVSDLKETAGTEQISYEEDDNCLYQQIHNTYTKKMTALGLFPKLINFYEEVTYFKTIREYWEWLLVEGNKVCPVIKSQDTVILYMREEVLYLYNNNREFATTIDYNISYKKYMPYIEQKWYTNIPEQGVFCWVNNFHNDRKDYIALIKEYDAGRDATFIEFRSEAKIIAFKFATPLTKEELLERCYEIHGQ